MADWKRVNPLPGESLDGLAMRFAERNLLGSIGAHLGRRQGHLSFGPGGDRGEVTIPQVTERLLLSPKEVALMAHYPKAAEDKERNFLGEWILGADIERRRRLFSPAGLALSPHHRAAWQLRPFPFCTESWEYLIDRCRTPRCETVQTWSGLDVTRCDNCMADLRKIPTTVVPAKLRDSLAQAAALLSHDPELRQAALAALPVAIAALGPAGALELVIRLLPVVDPSLSRRRESVLRETSPHQLADAMAAAWDIASGWPDAFVAFVGKPIARSGHRRDDGNRGATRRFLSLASRPDTPGRLKTFLQDFRGSLDHRREDSDLAHRVVDGEAAAKMLGLGTQELTFHRRNVHGGDKAGHGSAGILLSAAE